MIDYAVLEKKDSAVLVYVRTSRQCVDGKEKGRKEERKMKRKRGEEKPGETGAVGLILIEGGLIEME